MKIRRSEIAVLVLLVGLGVLLRLSLQHIPNFAPIAAIALFAGYFCRSRLLATLAPLCAMAISDLVLGGYHPLIMLTVYGSLALPVLAGPWLRRRCRLAGEGAGDAVRSFLALQTSAIGASVFFFAATNFTVWLQWYERSWASLLECYLLALPFFRYTLAGDATFALVLFSGYALSLRLGWLPNQQRDSQKLAVE